MGTYDLKLASIQKKIEYLQKQIDDINKKIDQLKLVSVNCDKANAKLHDCINNIFCNIKRNGSNINGNFVEYYKTQIERIFKKNGLYEVADSSSNDKQKIQQKIAIYENQIRKLCAEIKKCRSDLIYYKNKNLESEE